jgi:hypothetical protein
MIADHPPTVRTPANINVIIAAVVRETKSSLRYVTPDSRLTKPAGLRVFDDDSLDLFHYSRSAHLFKYYLLLRKKFYE